MSISLEHFAVIMEPLVDVWAIPKPETRIKHYYHQFQNTPKQVLIDAVQDWIRSQDRFPTINQLAERVRIHKAKMANQEEISECGYCKGSGIVTAISTHDASAFLTVATAITPQELVRLFLVGSVKHIKIWSCSTQFHLGTQ